VAFGRSPVTLRRLALASIAANVGIVLTGGAVRLTGSGLGCPTWPRCTSSSYVPTAALGSHGMIEFGNRTLTGVVGGLAVLALVSAVLQVPRRRPVTLLGLGVFAGIPAQIVLGAVTVRTHLNPWAVAGHFLLSMAVIATAYAFWRAAAGSPAPQVRGPLAALAWLLGGVSAVVLALGTVVTGSGPHAGDVNARRTGLAPGAVAQLHTDAVFLLVGLSVAVWFALRATGRPKAATRAAGWLVAAELAQGVVGFVQYVTHVPAGLVALHMAGACAVWLATLATVSAVTTQPARPAADLVDAPRQALVTARS
jgi:heme a synthase